MRQIKERTTQYETIRKYYYVGTTFLMYIYIYIDIYIFDMSLISTLTYNVYVWMRHSPRDSELVAMGIFGRTRHFVVSVVSVPVVPILAQANELTVCVNRTGLVPEHGRPIASCTTLCTVRPPFNNSCMIDGDATLRVLLEQSLTHTDSSARARKKQRDGC